MDFEIFVSERVDSSRNDAHLVFIEAQILNTVSIPHDNLSFCDQSLQRHLFILS